MSVFEDGMQMDVRHFAAQMNVINRRHESAMEDVEAKYDQESQYLEILFIKGLEKLGEMAATEKSLIGIQKELDANEIRVLRDEKLDAAIKHYVGLIHQRAKSQRITASRLFNWLHMKELHETYRDHGPQQRRVYVDGILRDALEWCEQDVGLLLSVYGQYLEFWFPPNLPGWQWAPKLVEHDGLLTIKHHKARRKTPGVSPDEDAAQFNVYAVYGEEAIEEEEEESEFF